MRESSETPSGETQRPAARRRRLLRPGKALAVTVITVTVVLALMLALVAALYVQRREAARQVLTGWLEKRGIEAEVTVERLEFDQLILAIRSGDPADPDFAVERVEADFDFTPPWAPGGLGASVRRVRLLRPVLKASWRDGVLSFGPLDPLIEEFRARPASPDSTAPLVLVEAGRLMLLTDHGPVEIRADGRLEDGRPTRLNAAVSPTTLENGDRRAVLEAARFDFSADGGEASLRVEAEGAFSAPGLDTRGLDLMLEGRAPWPDEGFTPSGPVRLSARVGAQSVIAGETALADVRLNLPDGVFSIETGDEVLRWRFGGPASLTSAGVSAGAAELDGLRLASTAITAGGRSGGGRAAVWEATGPAALSVATLNTGDLRLSGLSGQIEAEAVSDGGVRASARGGLRAQRGAWPLLGAPSPDDTPELAALKRAFSAFGLDAPGVRFATSGSGTEVSLERPARIAPGNGGQILVSARGRVPVFAARPGERGGGAARIAVSGASGANLGLEADIPDWRLTAGGFSARLDGRAAFDFTPARGIETATAGTLALDGGRLSYVTPDCLPLRVARLDFGENDARDVSGSICPPASGPLFLSQDGRWRADGRITGAAAEAPFLAMQMDGIAGEFSVTGGADGLGVDAVIERAGVTDTTEAPRFHPLTARGRAGLAGDVWSGIFDVAASGHGLGQMRLSHDGAAAAGGMVFETGELTFTASGLQPAAVTPLTEGMLEEPVEGRAGFTGRFDWTGEGATSEGLLRLDRLGFISPAGPVVGLSGEIAFTSLVPLVTAPGQRLEAESLTAFTTLSGLTLVFDLDAQAFRVEAGAFEAAGGRVTVETFTATFDGAAFRGALVLEEVRLNQLVEAAGFADKVLLDAVVSGRLPLVFEPGKGVRVESGTLHAIQPGRVSIRREALSNVEAGGGAPEAAPNVAQDMAYQAMENLSFDLLTADVNSLGDGRLGVRFRIRGRHDPAEHEDGGLNVPLTDLIRGRFMDQPLRLPSGTPVDLTLDTTLNLDELLADFADYNRARRGGGD